jgi:hypothetical protein
MARNNLARAVCIAGCLISLLAVPSAVGAARSTALGLRLYERPSKLTVARAAGGRRCGSYTSQWDGVTRVGHKKLFTTYLTSNWCWTGSGVVHLGQQRSYGATTTLGNVQGYHYSQLRGWAHESVQPIFIYRHGYYAVTRVMHWESSIPIYKIGSQADIGFKNFLYFDGKAAVCVFKPGQGGCCLNAPMLGGC